MLIPDMVFTVNFFNFSRGLWSKRLEIGRNGNAEILNGAALWASFLTSKLSYPPFNNFRFGKQYQDIHVRVILGVSEVAEVCIHQSRTGCSNWWRQMLVRLKLLLGVIGPEVLGLDPVILRDSALSTWSSVAIWKTITRYSLDLKLWVQIKPSLPLVPLAENDPVKHVIS